MYRSVLRKMQQCIQQGRCKARSHAYDEMDEDDIQIEDAMRAILNGRIRERQWDSVYHEYKYIVRGRTIAGYEIEVVAKIEQAEETVMIITVYMT